MSVYDVLKDTSKREKYDKVLRDGLPNWKSALYYYRRMRKMSIAEAVAIFFVIVTIAQYLFAWAAYIEKKYTAEQVFGSRLKKMQKKNKTNVGIDAIINEIPKPSVIVRNNGVSHLIRYLPYCFLVFISEYTAISNTYRVIQLSGSWTKKP